MTEDLKPAKQKARDKLLDASLTLIRSQGYAATTVDQLCASAGVTKGAFFHHFGTKDDLAVAAANHWSSMTGGLFASAPYHAPRDPLDRILAYLDFREALLQGTCAQFTCLAGTLLQETYNSSPEIRMASFASISNHAATLVPDFEAAIALYGKPDCPSATSLALHTQTVLQGSFILAKGSGSADIVRESLDHLRRYLKSLLEKLEERLT